MSKSWGPFIKDVRKIFGIFDPFPLVRIFARSILLKSRNLPYYDSFWVNPPSPLCADILYKWSLGVDLAHVALHGAPLLVGLVANEAEVVPARQHPHRGGHQGAPVGGVRRHSSDIYKKCRGTTFKRAECGRERKWTSTKFAGNPTTKGEP